MVSSFFNVVDLSEAEFEMLMAAVKEWSEATGIDVDNQRERTVIEHAADLMATKAAITSDELFRALLRDFPTLG